jgi:hypothetical protein
LVISDFIFSPGKGVDAENYLVNQQIAFKLLFDTKIKESNISTTLLKFHSRFKGDYFDKTNFPINFKSTPIIRPFYVLAIGCDEGIKQLISFF